MKLVFYSVTGNCRRIANKLSEKFSIKIEHISEYSGDDYILLTPTYNTGQIPRPVENFLIENHLNCKGTIVSGNTNWGPLFANAGKLIQEKFDIITLIKIEQEGTAHDLEKIGGLFN